MLDNIRNIMLTVLIAFQFVVMAYIFYTEYVRCKHDKKFWKQQEEISEEFLKQLKEQPAVYLNEERASCEQEDTNKK